MNDILKQKLIEILKDRISFSEGTRANYARGEDAYEPVLSKAVVFPENNEAGYRGFGRESLQQIMLQP